MLKRNGPECQLVNVINRRKKIVTKENVGLLKSRLKSGSKYHWEVVYSVEINKIYTAGRAVNSM